MYNQTKQNELTNLTELHRLRDGAEREVTNQEIVRGDAIDVCVVKKKKKRETERERVMTKKE